MQRVEFVPHYRCYSERCIGNRAGLHAKIAEPPPILCKDTNKPSAKANLFAFCRGEVSKTKSKYEKAGANTTGIRFYPGEVKDSERREKTGTCSLFSEAHPI